MFGIPTSCLASSLTYSALLPTPTSSIYSSLLALQSTMRTPVLFPAIHLSSTLSPARNSSLHPRFPLYTQPHLCRCSSHYHDLLYRSQSKLCAAEIRSNSKAHGDFNSLDLPLSLPYF
ncbi:hypothetical protein M0R45_019930 [Rubus argutus]|uniref:Uncharacterized protein n=1 Tax=Rubus argutus TaxID=59490 RepID=A0AAW1X7C5_RUBAR